MIHTRIRYYMFFGTLSRGLAPPRPHASTLSELSYGRLIVFLPTVGRLGHALPPKRCGGPPWEAKGQPMPWRIRAQALGDPIACPGTAVLCVFPSRRGSPSRGRGPPGCSPLGPEEASRSVHMPPVIVRWPHTAGEPRARHARGHHQPEG